MKRLLFVFAMCASATICCMAKTPQKPSAPFLVQDFRETEKKYLYSPEWYPDYVAVTIADFKNLLLKDTADYKVVIIYDQQPYFESLIRSYYAPYLAKQNDLFSLSTYYVANDCGALVTCEKFMRRCRVTPNTYYYFRDNSPKFIAHGVARSADRGKNILQFMFDNAKDCEVADNNQTWVIDKQGHVKLAVYAYKDLESLNGLSAMCLEDLYSIPLNQIDFEKIDTISRNHIIFRK